MNVNFGTRTWKFRTLNPCQSPTLILSAMNGSFLPLLVLLERRQRAGFEGMSDQN